MEQKIHIPVMAEEVMEHLALKPGQTVIDATMGTGGHSLLMLERIGNTGRLIGIDRDQESLQIAKARLGDNSNVEYMHGNFSELKDIAERSNLSGIGGILFDLGISSFQLQDSKRGFSFQEEGPLDMRMDRTSYISAYDLLNNLNEEEISNMLWTFGQERWHNRIARHLVQERQRHPISTTKELSNIVINSIPSRYRHFHYRIHPATRTFQAVRIAVNRELESLENAIVKAVDLLDPGARICVISFHSLEDRVVKFAFRKMAQEARLKIITPKPLTPRDKEVEENPRSRSSKLRVAEKI